MESYVGKVCPFCKTELKEGDAVIVCPSCGIAHHKSCWAENGGCTTFGCKEQQYAAQPPRPAAVCGTCGNALEDGQDFCPKCGTPRVRKQTNYCANCGAELQDGQEFCHRCGHKAGLTVDGAVASAINQYNAGVQKTNSKKKMLPLIIGIAAAAVVIIAIVLIVSLSGSKGPDFDKLYDEYCSPVWAKVGSDGSYLSIDTNPYDEDDNGLAYTSAYYAVEDVNNALGLPDSLFSEMGETTGADGKQTETFEELGITVSWKYHPDKGLEVTYKKTNN